MYPVAHWLLTDEFIADIFDRSVSELNEMFMRLAPTSSEDARRRRVIEELIDAATPEQRRRLSDALNALAGM